MHSINDASYLGNLSALYMSPLYFTIASIAIYQVYVFHKAIFPNFAFQKLYQIEEINYFIRHSIIFSYFFFCTAKPLAAKGKVQHEC